MEAGLGRQKINFPPMDKQVSVDYVFVGNDRDYVLSKTRTLNFEPKSVNECPIADCLMFDCWEADEKRRLELLMYPMALYPDPIRGGKNKIAICEFYRKPGKPSVINTRHLCQKTLSLESIKRQKPWFGFEQEYFMLNNCGRPLGWDDEEELPPEDYNSIVGHYYTEGGSPGRQREVAEAHYLACQTAGIAMYSMTREDAPGQWEYAIEPCEGIAAADQLLLSRYLLQRVGEIYEMGITFIPKPVKDADPASCVHINFSTEAMRKEGGMKHIKQVIDRLSKVPQKALLSHFDLSGGKEIAKCLNGSHYLPDANNFTTGVGRKDVTIRIPKKVAMVGHGYIEERRPVGNCDPYEATEAFVKAALIDGAFD